MHIYELWSKTKSRGHVFVQVFHFFRKETRALGDCHREMSDVWLGLASKHFESS